MPSTVSSFNVLLAMMIEELGGSKELEQIQAEMLRRLSQLLADFIRSKIEQGEFQVVNGKVCAKIQSPDTGDSKSTTLDF